MKRFSTDSLGAGGGRSEVSRWVGELSSKSDSFSPSLHSKGGGGEGGLAIPDENGKRGHRLGI